MGIPSREINGYAISNLGSDKPLSVSLKGGDLLHAWPEYYDPRLGWVQVDPTWGDTSNTDYFTKIDTNHFAFVIQGIRSDYPLPAGTYRTSEGQKLVEVDYSQNSDQPEFKGFYTVQKVFNWNIFKALAGYKRYKITNLGKIILYNKVSFDYKEGALLPDSSKTYYIKNRDQKIVFKNAFGEDFTQLLPN
jgi:hypothetical protein